MIKKIAIWSMITSILICVGLLVLAYLTPVSVEVASYSSQPNFICDRLVTIDYQAQGLINSGVDLSFEFWQSYGRLLSLIDRRNCAFDA